MTLGTRSLLLGLDRRLVTTGKIDMVHKSGRCELLGDSHSFLDRNLRVLLRNRSGHLKNECGGDRGGGDRGRSHNEVGYYSYNEE
jgi:hypothetical protein